LRPVVRLLMPLVFIEPQKTKRRKNKERRGSFPASAAPYSG